MNALDGIFGHGRWYQRFIPVAEALYDDHLEELAAELERLKPST